MGAIITIQVRRDTASNWTSTNPTLAAGEFGYETDTGKVKIGDGATVWTSLSYITSSGVVSTDTIWNAKGDLAAGAGSDSAGIVTLGTNGAVLEADSAQTYGVKWTTPKRTIYLSAAGGVPQETTPCGGPTANESSSNLINYYTLDFDKDSDEFAQWAFPIPDNYDGSTITAIVYWTAATGSGTVCWAVQGRAFANDDAIDQALGTAQTTTDTLIATGDVHVSGATSAITLAGSPDGGQWIVIQVYRDVSEDTLTDDALLLGVKLEYGTDSYSD